MGYDQPLQCLLPPSLTSFPNPSVISFTTNCVVDPSGGDVQGLVASVGAVEAAVGTGGCACGEGESFHCELGDQCVHCPQMDPRFAFTQTAQEMLEPTPSEGGKGGHALGA